MYLDSLIIGEESNGGPDKRLHVGEKLQKKYLALVKYLLEEGLDLLVAEIRRVVEGRYLIQKKKNPNGLFRSACFVCSSPLYIES